MPDGSVGEVYLDLVVRDTVDKQVTNLSNKATSSAKKAFTGLETTIGNAVSKAISKVSKLSDAIVNGPARAMDAAAGKMAGTTKRAFKRVSDSATACSKQIESSMNQSFNRATAMAQAKVTQLEAAMRGVTDKLHVAMDNDDDAEAARLGAQREQIYARLEAARQRLSFEVQAAAQKEAASEASTASRSRSVFSRAFVAIKNMGKRAFNIVGKAVSALKNKFSHTGRAASRFGTRLKGIIGSALIFNGISAALRKMTDYFGKAVSSSDSMKTALANLKGAAATATAPLIELLTPAITAITNAAATALSYLTRLISALTGKSVSKMTQAAQKIQAAVNSTKKALAGFDEIQKLDSGDSSSITPNYSFQGQSSFLDSVLDYVQQGNWASVGKALGNGINSAFDQLSKIDVGKKIGSLVNNVITTLHSLFSTIDFTAIGTNLGASFNDILKSIDWKKTGETIGAAIMALPSVLVGFILETDWAEVGRSLSETVSSALGSVTKWIQETDWMQLGKSAAELIKNIDWNKIAKDLFGLLGAALGASVSSLWSFINEVVADIGAYFTGKIDDCGGDIVGGLLKGIGDGLKDLEKWIYDNIVSPFVDAFNSVTGLFTGKPADENDEFVTVGNKRFNKTKMDKWFADNGYTTAIDVPKLATGGTIKQPTLAMLGEYAGARSNPEIAAPQSMIEQSVAKVLYGFSGDMAQGFDDIVQVLREILEAVLGIQIGDDVIGNAVNRYNSKIATARGTYV